MKAFSYYYKHLIRVVRRRPLQPILLAVILSLAFLVQTVATSVTTCINTENDRKNESACGNAAVQVEIGADAEVRFITSRAAEETLPNAAVTGVMPLSYLQGQTIVAGYAVDFDTVDAVFPLYFTERTTVPSAQRAEAVFITQAFADENDLYLGDSVTFYLFGQEVAYTVYGISPYPFLGDGAVLCDVTSPLALLTQKSTLLSLFADGVKVYSRLYVTGGAYDVGEMQATLAALYPDCVVSAVTKSGVTQGFDVFGAITALVVLFSGVAALIVAVTGCYCMAKEREEYTFLFSLVGFSRRRAYLYRVGEMLVYAAFGAGLGLLLSCPVGRYVVAGMGLQFVTFAISPGGALLAAGMSVLLCFLSPYLAEVVRFSGRKKVERQTAGIALIFCGIMAVCLVCVLTVPTPIRFPFAVAGVLSGVLVMALGVSPLLHRGGKRAAARAGKQNVPAVLARKNCTRVGELSNSCRLLAVLGAIILTVSFLVWTLDVSITLFYETVDADYVIMGGNADVPALLEQNEAVGKIFKLRVTSITTPDDKSLILWGVDDTDMFGLDMKNEELPPVGTFIGDNYSIEARQITPGQTFTVNTGSRTLSVSLYHGAQTCVPEMITAYESLEGVSTYYVVRAAQGVSDAELYSALSDVLADRMVTIAPTDELMEYYINSEVRYMYFCKMMLIIMLVFGLLGVVNNLMESVRSRREELQSFLLCGMTRRSVRKMLAREYLTVLRLALGLALVMTVLFAILANGGIRSFSADCFLYDWRYIQYHWLS